MTTNLEQQIARVVAASDFGVAGAVKRGRNPKWPYVPVIITTDDVGKVRTTQILGVAYVTRDEALAMARHHIDHCRNDLSKQLVDPRMRALRESYGLPRELRTQET